MTFPKSKRTAQCDANGKIIEIYFSMRECAEDNKIATTSLYKAIKGNYPINGFYFKYID